MDKTFKLDFIGIGAARSGTSWLANCLRAHPEICLSEPKDIRYFNFQDHEQGINKNHEKSFSWYMNHFRHCTANKIKGEFSAIYLYDKNAPSLIRKFFPEVKLIACLRNPIDRAYSQYWMWRSYQRIENRAFEYAIREESQYIERGYYSKQLKRYLEFFSIDQMFILLFDDMINHPLEELCKVFKFLNVSTDTDISSKILRKKVNPSRKVKIKSLETMLHSSQRLLINLRLSFLSFILRKIGVSSLIMKSNTVPFNYPDMKLETRKYLRNVFKDDIKELEKLLNRDLSHWVEVLD